MVIKVDVFLLKLIVLFLYFVNVSRNFCLIFIGMKYRNRKKEISLIIFLFEMNR